MSENAVSEGSISLSQLEDAHKLPGNDIGAALSPTPTEALTQPQAAEIRDELADLAKNSAENHTAVGEPFWWPHEHLDELRAVKTSRTGNRRSLDNSLWVLRHGTRHVRGSVMQALRPGSKGTERSEAWMREINGEGAEVLANKYRFIELAKELGYAPQRQTLVKAAESKEEHNASIGAEFPDLEQAVFLKPLGASGGRGVKIATAGDTERFIEGTGLDYVVQEAVQIEREYRYAVYQDGEHTWRIAYEKTRPTLQGDGQSTVKQLLDNQQLPQSTRIANMVINRRRLNQVLPAGESIQMQQVGFPKEGNFEKMPEDMHEIENLDRFMARFIGDLEQKIGHKLPLLAFDIGIKDPSVLKGEYDFDAIKANVIPFECQMPFSTLFYYKNVPKGRQTLVNFYKLIYGYPDVKKEAQGVSNSDEKPL